MPEIFEDYEKMYALRYLVYCKEFKYLDERNYPDKKEQDKYDVFSVHYILIDSTFHKEIVGTIRIIKNSVLGFPIENNFKLNIDLENIDRSKIVEISRLIVRKEYRSHYFTLDLVRELYHYSKKNNITHVYAVMDDNLYNPLIKMGFTFIKIGEDGNYQGRTTPYILVIDDLEKSLYKNNRIILDYLKYGL